AAQSGTGSCQNAHAIYAKVSRMRDPACRRQGNKIEAIQLVRREKGLEFKEAKEAAPGFSFLAATAGWKVRRSPFHLWRNVFRTKFRIPGVREARHRSCHSRVP